MEVKRMARILVPIDGSDLSLAAVPLADKLASGLGAEMVFVTVGELPETPAHADDMEKDLTGRIARVAGLVSSPVREKVVKAGDPVRGILEPAEEENVDLIVMGTHGRFGLAELTQGSIASDLVRHGHVPITLVRPENADQLD